MLLERVTLVLRATAVLVVAILVTFLALPSPTRSAAWTPQRAPNLEGVLAANDVLLKAERIAPGQLVGPEDVVVDDLGRITTGTLDGKIVRTRQDGSVEVLTETGGRPLGLALGPNGDLYVADTAKGLLRVDPDGHIEVLAHEVEGREMMFCNDVDVARNGTLYFTDSSTKWGYGDQVYDLIEQVPTGRLMKLDMKTRAVTVLLRGLSFANGVALATDESYVLVNETGRYRTTRFWLTGEKRNMAEPFMENLPGFPDNISRTERGTYWIAFDTVRKTLLDRLHPHPFLKDCIASLPASIRPRPQAYGLVIEVDDTGRVLRTLQDPTGRRFRDVSGVFEYRGAVYIGTLTGTALGRAIPPPVAR